MSYRPTHYGIDPELIEAAIGRARRERNAAFRALLGRLFSRRSQPVAAGGEEVRAPAMMLRPAASAC